LNTQYLHKERTFKTQTAQASVSEGIMYIRSSRVFNTKDSIPHLRSTSHTGYVVDRTVFGNEKLPTSTVNVIKKCIYYKSYIMCYREKYY